MNHVNWSIFNGPVKYGGLKFLEYKLGWSRDLGPPQKFRFPRIVIFPVFWAGDKIYQIVLKRSMVVLADSFVVLL